MGNLNVGSIITRGLALAGNSKPVTEALFDLNAWLRDEYTSWDWPFLQRRIAGVVLGQGTTSLDFGAGSSVSEDVQRVRQLTGGSELEDETINNPSTNRGLPYSFKVRADDVTEGKWNLIPSPVPNKQYLLAIDYVVQPDDLASNSDVPIYPSDKCLIQRVHHFGLVYSNRRPEAAEEMRLLADMTLNVRIRKGTVDGTNDNLGLDESVFAPKSGGIRER